MPKCGVPTLGWETVKPMFISGSFDYDLVPCSGCSPPFIGALVQGLLAIPIDVTEDTVSDFY